MQPAVPYHITAAVHHAAKALALQRPLNRWARAIVEVTAGMLRAAENAARFAPAPAEPGAERPKQERTARWPPEAKRPAEG